MEIPFARHGAIHVAQVECDRETRSRSYDGGLGIEAELARARLTAAPDSSRYSNFPE